MGGWGRALQAIVRMLVFTRSELGPLSFEHWSGHHPSCLLTGSLWLPCREGVKRSKTKLGDTFRGIARIQVKDGVGCGDGGGEERLGSGCILKYSQQSLWMWHVWGRKDSRGLHGLWCEQLEWNCH